MGLLMQKILNTVLVTTTLLIVGHGVDLFINKGNPGNLPIAYAQDHDQQKIKSYAEAILEIEPLRKETYQDLQQILEREQLPDISCDREASYNELPSEARSRIIDYCNQAKAIADKHGLSASEFNQITEQIQQDSQLKEQIKRQMWEQQQ